MITLLNDLYFKLKKDEIERAYTILKLTKIDTMLQSLSKVCWKNNIEYKIIIKTSSSVSLVLRGYYETVLFKYHKAEMVSKEEIDFFMNLMDDNRAEKGVYITTGNFDFQRQSTLRNFITYKKDIILQDGVAFIKSQLGLKGNSENLKADKIDFFKYLPN
jgi:hypothetical protein